VCREISTELADQLRQERSQLNQEVNCLHTWLGDLDLENTNLKEHLEQILHQLQVVDRERAWSCSKMRLLTGLRVVAANNASGLKKLVEQALALLR